MERLAKKGDFVGLTAYGFKLLVPEEEPPYLVEGVIKRSADPTGNSDELVLETRTQPLKIARMHTRLLKMRKPGRARGRAALQRKVRHRILKIRSALS